ncbi:hypothetical protein [Parabacteroides timonensis]|nr:hypothetical protein [Parabacteroides timonensis]
MKYRDNILLIQQKESSLPEQDTNYNKSKDERTGIFRLTFDVGIRFYF